MRAYLFEINYICVRGEFSQYVQFLYQHLIHLLISLAYYLHHYIICLLYITFNADISLVIKFLTSSTTPNAPTPSNDIIWNTLKNGKF